MIIICDPDGKSHRLEFARYIAEESLASGRDCTLVTDRNVMNFPETRVLKRAVPELKISFADVPTPQSAVELTRRLLDDEANERVIWPESGPVIRIPPSRVTAKLSLLMMLMRPISSSPNHRARAALRLLLAHRLRRSGAIVGGLVQHPGEHAFGLMPVIDPVNMTAHSRQRHEHRTRLSLPSGPMVGIFGLMGRRKNIPLAMAAVSQVPGCRLLLAGQLVEGVRDLIPENDDRFIVRDQFLSATDLDAYIAASDAALLLNAHAAPSGILGKCELGQVAVVSSCSKYLAGRVRHGASGLAVKPTPAAVAAGIQFVLTSPPRFLQTETLRSGHALARQLLGLQP